MSGLCVCRDCGTVSTEADLRVVHPDFRGDDPYMVGDNQVVCPRCESSDIDERELCTACTNELGEDALDGRCETCFRSLMGDAEGMAIDGEAMTAWIDELRGEYSNKTGDAK